MIEAWRARTSANILTDLTPVVEALIADERAKQLSGGEDA